MRHKCRSASAIERAAAAAYAWTMKAIGFSAPHPVDHPEALVEFEQPVPTPGARDVRVRVHAVSVNPVDVKVRASARPPAPRVLGFDAAGVVDAIGSDVTLFAPGDEVWYAGAIDRPGSNAELQLVDERLVARKPRSLDFADAAALPLTAITAWELLFDRLAVPRSPAHTGTLLIVNGAGGVGSILTQLARRLTGLTVIATASRPESRAWAERMGAHHVIDHRQPLDQALAAIGIPQVERIAGLTGSEQHRAAFIEAIAPQGRISLIDDPSTFDIVPFKRKSVSLHWELMFTRSLFHTADAIEQHRLLAQVAALVDDGTLVHTATERLGPINAANLRAAHAKVEQGRSIGKTVLAGW